MRKGGKMSLELSARAFRTVHESDLLGTFAEVTGRSTGWVARFRWPDTIFEVSENV